MKKIVLLGAGKSSVYIIDYLSNLSITKEFKLIVADVNAQNLKARCEGKSCESVLLLSTDFSEIENLIANSFLVISMLPASLHPKVAKSCLQNNTHLITPSYISTDMQALDAEAKKQGLIFLNEMGLDPGIDHLSVMKIVDEYTKNGAKIVGLKSHCGGLVAPKSDTNSWHYKISWNPRNVVLAGSGDEYIQYKADGEMIKLRYEQLFAHTSKLTTNDGINYESYPNRDSLKYEKVYGLDGIATLYRGTLRIPPFCEAWNTLVSLGYTAIDSSFPMIKSDTIADKKIQAMLQELGVFDMEKTEEIAADVLQKLVEDKWKMEDTDCDRVVMIHEFEIEQNQKTTKLQSSFVVDGENAIYTAMAKTVGLPIAFASELILEKKINERGVLLPISKEIYEPVLAKLAENGVVFEEKTRD